MNTNLVRHGVLPLAVVLVVAASAAGGQWSTGAEAPDPAVVIASGGAIELFPSVAFSRAILTAANGDEVFRWVFAEGERPSIGRFNPEGDVLADGPYTWELELIPDARTARELRIAASESGGEATGLWPRQSGSFTIQDGAIVTPDVVEPGEEGKAEGGGFTSETPAMRVFGSASAEPDSDGSGLSEEDFRAASGIALSAAEPFYGAGLQRGEAMAVDDSDFMTLAAGQPLDGSAAAFAMQPSESSRARIGTRTLEPGGTNGRPEKED